VKIPYSISILVSKGQQLHKQLGVLANPHNTVMQIYYAVSIKCYPDLTKLWQKLKRTTVYIQHSFQKFAETTT